MQKNVDSTKRVKSLAHNITVRHNESVQAKVGQLVKRSHPDVTISELLFGNKT